MAPKERQVAALLAERAQQFCDAVALRRESIATSDRFYRDLMVYQWRLEALDARIAAVAATAASMPPTATAIAPSDTCPGGTQDSSTGSAMGAATKSQHTELLDYVLVALQEQRCAAVAALEERAAHYAVGAPAATGRLEQMSIDEADRQRGMEYLRALAQDTYDEIADEAHEILEVPPSESGLRALCAALKRRRDFWHGQMEETFAAWQQATERMHRAGEEALVNWGSVTAAVRAAPHGWQLSGPCTGTITAGSAAATRQQQDLPSEVLQALATASARCLEAELLETLGLSGLCTGAQDVDFSREARLALLTSMLKCLKAAEALHRVGEALLQALASRAACGGPPSLCCPLRNWTGNSTIEALGPWLIASLAESLCDVARRGDIRRSSDILRFCSTLGGSALANSVRATASTVRSNRGLTAGQLASVAGFTRMARLLKEWPPTDDDRSQYKASDWGSTGGGIAAAKPFGQLEWLADWRLKPSYAKWVHRAWLGSLL
mmetsp:Transcript_116335/g.290492  ORF Transcript_116335/g.290492 Transcript_116335/m.290492 type:complete len:497 (+) Transcript_116335:116-1606(+)